MIDNFTANNHQLTISLWLSRINKSWDNVICLIGDNTSTNQRIADLQKIPFVGCYSHRLNLGVKVYMREHEENIKKIDEIMKILKQKKIAGKLISLGCNDIPQRKNATRWGSELTMLISFKKILPYLQNGRWGNRTPLEPYFDDLENLKSLVEGNNALIDKLKLLEMMSKGLQRQDTSLHEARLTFDHILSNENFQCMEQHLGTDFVRKPLSKAFESAIIKITQKKEFQLTDAEKQSVENLLRTNATENQQESDLTPEFNFELIKKRARMESHEHPSNYIDISFVEPTSNIAERLFSRTRKVRTYDRMRMKPSVLEIVMLLKYNRDLWNADTIIKAKKNPRNNDRIPQMVNRDVEARARMINEILENDEIELPNHFLRTIDYDASDDEISMISAISEEEILLSEQESN